MSEHAIIGELLVREGWPKYTEHPADRGGPTKGGITLAAWRELHPGATKEDLQAITEAQARHFYRAVYVVAPAFDRIRDESLRDLVIDAAVQHGPRHAAKWLQTAAGGLKVDGAFGPRSQAAVDSAKPLQLYLAVLAYRLRLYGRLVQRDAELKRARLAGFHLQAEFAEGWNNRAADFIEAAVRRITVEDAFQ